MTLEVRADLAEDATAVLTHLAGPIEASAGFRPQRCRVVGVLKRTDRRLVVLYEISGEGKATRVVGKWYANDRGALVAVALTALRAQAETARVPALICYVAPLRALFTEYLEGSLLRDVLRVAPSAALSAGAWLAGFHRSGLQSPRSCGPQKQARAVRRWSEVAPVLAASAAALEARLLELPDPRAPVHYDFYHSQVLVLPGGAAVVDLDESGMGDPAFDLAHFEAHLELLALQWHGDARRFQAAAEGFRAGYERVASLPVANPVLEAFSWYKLAHQLLKRKASPDEQGFALRKVDESLS